MEGDGLRPAGGRDTLLHEGIALAMRALRRPRSGVAAILAVASRATGARLAAVYAFSGCWADGELVAAGGPDATPLGSPGPVDGDMTVFLEACVLNDGCDGDEAPPPWSGYPHLVPLSGHLPLGEATVLLAAGTDQPDRSVLETVAGPVDLLVGALGSLRRLERLEADLLRHRRDRALAEANLHHDLRTPLTSIMGCAATLGERWGSLTDREREELLGIVSSQAGRLNDMVSDSLRQHASGIDAPVLAVTLDPQEVADRAAGAARAARGGRVMIDVEPGRIQSDPRRLERALLNLIDNALKYSPPDEPVRVVGAGRGDHYTLTVADAGGGVSPDVVSAMFSPYATDPGRRDGTGLGLHSVARLMDELGGTVSHARRDGWTRFSLSIPCRGAVSDGSPIGSEAAAG